MKSRTSNACDYRVLTIPELQPEFKATDSAIYPRYNEMFTCRESVASVSGRLAISKWGVTPF